MRKCRFSRSTAAAVATLIVTGVPLPAYAFCGAFVGDPDDTLSNTSSEVVLARDGDETVLTLIMNYEGSASEFAVLLPIPKVVTAEDVGSIDQNLVDWIGDFSVPRQVAYSCDDIFETKPVVATGCALGFGCSSYGAMAYADKFESYDSGVTVESAFVENGYEFVVLSADESTALFTWLETNGYAVPAGGETILQEYIDAGVYFLAAKVALAKVELVDGWLPPIQIRYESDFFGLPIRIGTISATGPQNVVIYALTPLSDGEVQITNYPELALANECTWHGDDFGDWYEELVTSAWEENGAGWVREYSWDLEPVTATGYHCDPCTAEAVAPTPDGTFSAYGLRSRGAHLTRLQMRYSADQATMDLGLSVSGLTGINEQLKFINPVTELEFLFPDCIDGYAENPGTCPDQSEATEESAGTAAGLVAGAVVTLLAIRRQSRHQSGRRARR